VADPWRVDIVYDGHIILLNMSDSGMSHCHMSEDSESAGKMNIICSKLQKLLAYHMADSELKVWDGSDHMASALSASLSGGLGRSSNGIQPQWVQAPNRVQC
jgi:hypothetical protein